MISSPPMTWLTNFPTSASRRQSTGFRPSTLLLEGDAGFSHGDKLAFVAEYVLGFGLLCALNYAQRLSVILLALLRFDEFRHSCGKHNPPTLAWLHARKMRFGNDDARMHTALKHTDDVVLAAVGTDRIVALL
eukprot:742843-Pleurochrysis_carterae.AAC.1